MAASSHIPLVMDPEEIEKLHEAAVGFYVSGRYAEARRAWEAVLASVPEDARAIEGIRMVRVLAGEWPAEAAGLAGPIEDELRHVEELLAQGRYGDALLAAQRTTEADPGSADARRLAARALELFEAAPYIDVELTTAKQAIAEGRSDDARSACQKILSIDPAHAAAAELLAHAGGEIARTPKAPASVPVSKPASSPATKTVAPSVVAPLKPAAPAPAPSPIKPPAADAFFDITDDDLIGDAPPMGVTPLGRPSAGPDAGSAGGESHHENAHFDSSANVASEKKRDAISGFTEAEGSAHHSLFEMPEEDVPTIKASFSELEAEIDETYGPSEGVVDFDVPAGAPSATSSTAAPAAKGPTPAADDPIDFSFGEEDFALPGDVPATPASTASPEARIAGLLDESRRALKAGRYSEAIEAAARAFAIDPDAQGAQQLIDEARTRQDEADQVAEENLLTGRDKLSAGDLAGAEEAFRAVLKIHPSHHEALDGLDQVSRRRNEAEIQGGKRGAMPAPAAEKKPERGPSTSEAIWSTESLMPKAPASKRATAPATPRPFPSPILSAPVARRRRSGIGRRLFGLVAVIGVLALFVAGGYFAISLFTPPSRPIEKAVLTPRRERREPAKVNKPAPAPAPAEKPKADPAALAEGVPRTIPEAKRLASEGKLEAARVVLADMVRAAPDNVAAVDALKAVQAQIIERDQVAESMDQIRHAYKQERYEDALRMLYRLPSEMQRGEIEKYKVNAWYNNGINYLLGGNTVEAIHCFDEALNIDPHDQQAQRLRSYSKTYSDREKDSAFRTFVDQLDKRPIDAQ